MVSPKIPQTQPHFICRFLHFRILKFPLKKSLPKDPQRSHHPPPPEDPGDRPDGAPSLRSPAVFPSWAPAEGRAVRDPPRTASAPTRGAERGANRGMFQPKNWGNQREINKNCMSSLKN